MDDELRTGGRNAEPLLEEIRREHRAFAILRALDRLPDYRCNDGVLCDRLDRLALGGTREATRASLDRLVRLGAIQLEEVDRIVVVELTDKRGGAGGGQGVG